MVLFYRFLLAAGNNFQSIGGFAVFAEAPSIFRAMARLQRWARSNAAALEEANAPIWRDRKDVEENLEARKVF